MPSTRNTERSCSVKRYKFVFFTACLAAVISLSSCSSTLEDYQGSTPEFDLKDYFTGDLKGWGLVKNWKGEVIERFSVDLNGSWENDKGHLYELFTYADGRTQERIWRLQKQDDNTSIGEADDVIGIATGKQAGFAFNWSYQLQIDTENGPIVVTLNDWLYQINNEALVSEAQIKKFGLNVGEVLVFIVKQEESHG